MAVGTLILNNDSSVESLTFSTKNTLGTEETIVKPEYSKNNDKESIVNSVSNLTEKNVRRNALTKSIAKKKILRLKLSDDDSSESSISENASAVSAALSNEENSHSTIGSSDISLWSFISLISKKFNIKQLKYNVVNLAILLTSY